MYQKIRSREREKKKNQTDNVLLELLDTGFKITITSMFKKMCGMMDIHFEKKEKFFGISEK